MFAVYHRNLSSFSSILCTQRQNIHLLKLIELIKTSPSTIPVMLQYYCLVKDVLFYRRYQWLECVPQHRVKELIQNIHLYLGHVGSRKYLFVIRDFCFCKSLQTLV